MSILTANYWTLTAEYRQMTSHYSQVLDSIEVYGMSRITYNEKINNRPVDPKQTGVPDVWRINPVANRDRTSTPMTRGFQFWIYRINIERILGRRLTDVEFTDYYQAELGGYKIKHPVIGFTIRDFNSLFRAKGSHTNFAGTDNSTNFIAQENLEGDYPKFSNIVTGGWVGIAHGNQFEVINASKPYTHYHPFTHPHLFDEPLSTGREFVPSTNQIKRDDIRRKYNDFGDKVVMPVILPASDYGIVEGKIIPTDELPLSKFQ